VVAAVGLSDPAVVLRHLPRTALIASAAPPHRTGATLEGRTSVLLPAPADRQIVPPVARGQADPAAVIAGTATTAVQPASATVPEAATARPHHHARPVHRQGRRRTHRHVAPPGHAPVPRPTPAPPVDAPRPPHPTHGHGPGGAPHPHGAPQRGHGYGRGHGHAPHPHAAPLHGHGRAPHLHGLAMHGHVAGPHGHRHH
jgi:hypothetical protein